MPAIGMVLTPDEVDDVLNTNTRNRGGVEKDIRNFAASGELYVDCRTFEGMETLPLDSLYNKYSNKNRELANAAKLAGKEFPALKVAKTGSKEQRDDERSVLLINLAVHAAQKAAKASDASEGSESEAA